MSAPLDSAAGAPDVVVGVDLGGTKVLACVVDGAGHVVRRVLADTPPRSAPSRVAEDALVDAVHRVVDGDRLVALGVAAAGFVDAAGDRVRFAPHVAWRDEPLRARLAGRVGVPVHLDNDANLALWAEHRFGAARGARDVVLVAVGTGIGGALLVDGALFRGHGGMAGEFGHMQVQPGGRPCECGQSGCWEQYVSGPALARLAGVRLDGRPTSGPQVTALAMAGDERAAELFAEIGRDLGTGLAGLAAALDPELFVVGGGVAATGELLLGPARAALAERLPGARHREMPRVHAAELGTAAGCVGAADLARRLVRTSG